jgi:hypothetical protein
MDHWWEIGLPDAHAPALVRAIFQLYIQQE